MTIPSAAHAGFEVVVCKELSLIGTGILNALIGMDQNFVVRFSAPQGHQQGIDDKIRAGTVFHAPTDDLPREYVQDNRQVQPAFVGADVGKICDPRLVGALDLELTNQSVWCDVTDTATFKTSMAVIAPQRANSCAPHNPMHTIFCHRFHPDLSDPW